MEVMPLMEASTGGAVAVAGPLHAVHSAQAAAKANDEDDHGQRGRETHLAHPCQGIEGQPMVPSAILLSGFQRLLQAHTRCSQKARRRLSHRQHVHLLLEFLLRRKLSRAVLAAPDVLLQLVARVVSQLVVQIERRVLLYPFAIHDYYLYQFFPGQRIFKIRTWQLALSM